MDSLTGILLIIGGTIVLTMVLWKIQKMAVKKEEESIRKEMEFWRAEWERIREEEDTGVK